ncbi:MAG: 2OG-Fe(II) oxygenase [Parvibaculales bacterium]
MPGLGAQLNMAALNAAVLKTDPYEYLVVENFINPESFGPITADFPAITEAGSFPPETLDIHGAFADLLVEMDGETFRQAIEAKFNMTLTDYPTMFTVRGKCALHNGKIHNDSATKIITVLLYLNDAAWQADGGRLRILRDQHDLNNMAEEINPNGGTLLVFRRSDRSWHGHEPFEGVRRAIQMNWVASEAVVEHEQRRHKFSAFVKRLNPVRAFKEIMS